jgi:competence protein CoiA
MRYAHDNKKAKIEVSYSGQVARCPDCDSYLQGKKGRFRTYWSHKTKADCDTWHEPITKWHIDWQNLFPRELHEVRLIDKTSGMIHRADICFPNGTVIEIQNSPIKVEEIEQREKFYGRNNLIWILNGKKLASQSKLHFNFEKQLFAISYEIPNYIEEFPAYNMDSFNLCLFKSDEFKRVQKNRDIKTFDCQNGNFFWFEFKDHVDFNDLINQLEEITYNLVYTIYGKDAYDYIGQYFITQIYNRPRDSFYSIELIKKYWRPFVDLLTFPVYFDNLDGLSEELLYYYQENKIIKKTEFLEIFQQSLPQQHKKPR